VNILEAIDDPKLFKPWFKDPETWKAWRAFLCALFSLPMSEEQLAVYRECTDRTDPPAVPVKEAFLICGRRAGKSLNLALVAVFEAAFSDLRSKLAPGERATVMVVAADRKQARVIFRYVRGLLTHVPMLAPLIEKELAESFDLSNGVTIEVGTANFRSVRGYSLALALVDELAFLKTEAEESGNVDVEVLNALRPGLATTGGRLLCASSPYARRGALFEAWTKHYAQNGDPILVWQARTRTMNPTVPQSIIDDALERDFSAGSAEWNAVFRTDVESLITIEAVRACIRSDASERLPNFRNRYSLFVDAASGSGTDSFTCAVAHREGDTCVLDCIREWRPNFSPEAVCEEVVELAKKYRCLRVRGDRWASGFVGEQFTRRGIHYESADKTKSELYLDMLPLINSGACDLLRNERMVQQIVSLERRTTRGGRDVVDHGPAGASRDDVANAVAGALVYCPPASRMHAREPGGPVILGVSNYDPVRRQYGRR
jgi:hypothetical protein